MSDFTDEQIMDEAAEMFQDAVFNHELLDLYSRGLLGLADLTERLEYFKAWAEQKAEESLEIKESSRRDENEADAYQAGA